jgi:hypothetical protein
MRDRGAVLIEAALVLPILITLIVSSLIFGLAVTDDIRLERAAADAARLPESEARQVVESVGGTLVCYSESGECFDDGLTIDRVQVVAEGRTWSYPTGTITPTAHVSRPTEGN